MSSRATPRGHLGRKDPVWRWCAVGATSVALHALALAALPVPRRATEHVVPVHLSPPAPSALLVRDAPEATQCAVTPASHDEPVVGGPAGPTGGTAATVPETVAPRRAVTSSSRAPAPEGSVRRPPSAAPAPAPTPRVAAASAPRATAVGAPSPRSAGADTSANGPADRVVGAEPRATGTASPPPDDREPDEGYVRTLARMIGAHRHYPSRARRRHEQGTVVIGLRLNADGGLAAQPVVLQSSHVDALDASAVAAVARALPLPAPPDVGPDGTVSLRVPFVYSLRN